MQPGTTPSKPRSGSFARTAGGILNIRALVLSGVCLAAMALIMPVASAQQGVGDLAGAWKIEPASTHEGLPVELLLKVSDSEVTIARNGGRPEVYKFDPTGTQPPDGRNGKAEFAGGTLTLTLTRGRYGGTPAHSSQPPGRSIAYRRTT